MRILLIVGNGFDLNLGLPTSYRHFYKYYLEHTESRNEHVNKLKSIIKDDIENWSDLELKLGEVTEQFTSPNHIIAAFRDLKIRRSSRWSSGPQPQHRPRWRNPRIGRNPKLPHQRRNWQGTDHPRPFRADSKSSRFPRHSRV